MIGSVSEASQMFFRVLMVRESVSSISCDSGDSDEIHKRERKRKSVCVCVFEWPKCLVCLECFGC